MGSPGECRQRKEVLGLGPDVLQCSEVGGSEGGPVK